MSPGRGCCLLFSLSLESPYRTVFSGYMLRRGALSSQFSTSARSIYLQSIPPSIRDVPDRNFKAMEPNSQRGKTSWSQKRSGTDSQGSGSRGGPYRGRGGGRGRGKPRRRGGGGSYADRSGPATATAAAAAASSSMDMAMGTSQMTGFPIQPFMPFQTPGTDVSGSFNAPWWGFMNPAAAGALPFVPPHPPAINPNFPMPAMFNPTIPMFSPFYPNSALNYGAASYPDPNDRPRVDDASNSPEAPEATSQYLAQASLSASPTQTAQPLLIVLDLNGTLIHRRNRKFPPSFTRRSLLDKFLNTLLLKHKVMVWSSSQPKTVKAICQQLFSPMQRKTLLAEWGRDKLNLTTSQYKSKVQVYKTLETIWADQTVQSKYPKPILHHANGNEKSRWDQSNTVLIDDSKLKALSEPFNIIELPEYEGFETPGQDGATIFPKVLSRLDMLSRHDDVSKVLHGWSRTDTDPATDTGREFLDFELNEHDRRHIFSPSVIDPEPPNPEQPQARTPTRTPKEEAHVQKRLLRKAMKNERKAAKEARDLKSVCNNTNNPLYGSTPEAGSDQGGGGGGGTTQHDDGWTLKERRNQMRKQKRAGRRDRGRRSPSVSEQSENQLLDRLEESLTV